MPPQHHDPPPIAQINQSGGRRRRRRGPSSSHSPWSTTRRSLQRPLRLHVLPRRPPSTIRRSTWTMPRTSPSWSAPSLRSPPSTSAPSLTRGSAGCAARSSPFTSVSWTGRRRYSISSASGSSGTSGRSVRRARPRQTGDTRTRRDFDLSGFETSPSCARAEAAAPPEATSLVIFLATLQSRTCRKFPTARYARTTLAERSEAGTSCSRLKPRRTRATRTTTRERKDARRESRELDARRRTTPPLLRHPPQTLNPSSIARRNATRARRDSPPCITFTRSCVPPAPR